MQQSIGYYWLDHINCDQATKHQASKPGTRPKWSKLEWMDILYKDYARNLWKLKHFILFTIIIIMKKESTVPQDWEQQDKQNKTGLDKCLNKNVFTDFPFGPASKELASEINLLNKWSGERGGVRWEWRRRWWLRNARRCSRKGWCWLRGTTCRIGAYQHGSEKGSRFCAAPGKK